MSSYAIQRRLLEHHVPTRKAHTQGWAQSTVVDILRSPLYKGDAWYNRKQKTDASRPHGTRGFKDRRQGNGRGRMLHPAEEWIPVSVPAIVESEVWEMAQRQLAQNRARATRHNAQHRYLLRGLLVCGHCRRRLISVWGRVGGRYICSARYPHHTPWTCNGRSLGADKADKPAGTMSNDYYLIVSYFACATKKESRIPLSIFPPLRNRSAWSGNSRP
jgi:site-specific DNA recombinase